MLIWDPGLPERPTNRGRHNAQANEKLMFDDKIDRRYASGDSVMSFDQLGLKVDLPYEISAFSGFHSLLSIAQEMTGCGQMLNSSRSGRF